MKLTAQNLLTILTGFVLFFIFASPVFANEKAKKRPASLVMLVHPAEGDIDRDWLKRINTNYENALFHFTDYTIYTQSELYNQIGFERKSGYLDCALIEECAEKYKNRIGLTHEIFLKVRLLVDGKYSLAFRMEVGEEGRRIIETIPELLAAKPVIERAIPDLIGVSDGVRRAEGIVRVSSFPLGAKVKNGQAHLCDTPCAIKAEEGETLRLLVEGNDRRSKRRRLTVKRGEVIRWFADLVKKRGDVLADSEPAGANVFLDGQRAGVTPIVIENITEGEHELRFVMPPYPEKKTKVMVKGDEVVRVLHGFQSGKGELKVMCADCPEGARVEIFLNGEKVGENLYVATLEKGVYRVHVVSDGYATVEESLEIKPGKRLVFEPKMKEGLSVRPGQVVEKIKDYRAGGFSVGIGAFLTAFGAFLEVEAGKHYDRASGLPLGSKRRCQERNDGKNSRIAGGVLMGVGAATVLTGVFLLIWPPEMEIAVTPSVDPRKKEGKLSFIWRY